MNSADHESDPTQSDKAETIALEAQRLEASGDLGGAVGLLSSALQGGYDHPGLWHNLGNLLLTLESWREAIDAFDHAVSKGFPSESNRGLAYEHIGQLDKAFLDYSAALARDSEDLVALVNLGTLELSRHNLPQAKERLEQAASQDPTANWQLADVYSQMGQPQAAIHALERAIAAGEARAHLDRAVLIAETTPYEDVSADFEAAIRAGAQGARRQFAVYLDTHGKPELALEVAEAGIAEGDASCFAPAAVVSESLGLKERAVRYYRAAIESGETAYEDDLQNLLSQ